MQGPLLCFACAINIFFVVYVALIQEGVQKGPFHGRKKLVGIKSMSSVELGKGAEANGALGKDRLQTSRQGTFCILPEVREPGTSWGWPRSRVEPSEEERAGRASCKGRGSGRRALPLPTLPLRGLSPGGSPQRGSRSGQKLTAECFGACRYIVLWLTFMVTLK